MSPKPVCTDIEKRRRAIFDRAMRLPDAKRIAYIERETAGDPLLRAAVLRLLAANRPDSSGVLDRPVYPRRPVSAPGLVASVGAYPVVRCLGAGGMGNVFLCREPRGGDLVAVKVLNAALRSRNFLERFENERIIQSRLQHPNVCRILGSGATGDGVPFIVMEYVEGEHIDVFLRRVRSTPAQCLLLFSQVLAAVEYFHKQDIVHRDLKPSNILVNTAGAVKILDFGVARVVEHASGFTGQGATNTAMPIMTIRYASPEQLEQRVSGRSSDIYSLGVLLYELLTGQHPFSSELRQGQKELVAAMAGRTPAPPSNLCGPRHAIPEGADRMIMKALRFDPAKRYRSAGQLLDDLRSCLQT